MTDYSNYKTIKQVAGEIGISKQALHKRMKNEPLNSQLKPYIIQKGNTVHIENRGVSIIKSFLIKDGSVDDVDDIDNEKGDSVDDVDVTDYKSIDKVDNIDMMEEVINNGVDDVDILGGDEVDDVDIAVDDVDNLLKSGVGEVDNVDRSKGNDFVSKYILNLEEQVKELKQEREHSRLQVERLQNKIINQSDRIADLAEKLAELTRNSQILHKQEQDKNALSSPEQPTTVSSEPDANDTKLKQRPFWQFWKK